LVFPSQTVGATSAPQIVTLTNPGSSQLTISSVAIESSDYSLTTTCGGSLQPGQQCTISIRFEPTAPGTRTATLQIQTNASNVPGGTLNIPLTGTGIAAIPAATVSPTSLSFGIVLTNSSSTRVVTLTSTGTTSLLITGIAIAGTAAGSFSQSSTCGGSLQSGQQCTITVVFRPATIGLLSATLQITTNAGLISVGLSGTGENPKNVTKDNKDAKDLHEKPGGIEKHIQVENTHPEFRSPTVSGEDLTDPGGATKSAFINPEERPPVGPQF
jgi:Abnormal spindle-like microcephaly-assoc'd, ASPM-SPD-2-Hydin